MRHGMVGTQCRGTKVARKGSSGGRRNRSKQAKKGNSLEGDGLGGIRVKHDGVCCLFFCFRWNMYFSVFFL